MGKEEPTGSGSDMDYITVQRLYSNVEGRYQKYARIGALAMAPLGEACKRFFEAEDMDCHGDHHGLRRVRSRTGRRRFTCMRFIERGEKAKCATKWR